MVNQYNSFLVAEAIPKSNNQIKKIYLTAVVAFRQLQAITQIPTQYLTALFNFKAIKSCRLKAMQGHHSWISIPGGLTRASGSRCLDRHLCSNSTRGYFFHRYAFRSTQTQLIFVTKAGFKLSLTYRL